MPRLQHDVPFDQYSRQYQVAAMIDALRNRKETFRILDVGGYKGKTAEFFPNDKVLVLDVFDVTEPNYVKGDGANLPFGDRSFDFVVNFDVLEHIPKSQRGRFVRECMRVADRAVFFSGPHKTAANEAAELALNDLYKELHRKEHRWLQEHIAYGLPDFAVMGKNLEKDGFYTAKFSSNDTLVWQLMQGVIFLNSKYPMAASETLALNEYYNERFPFDGGESTDTTYRLIMVAARKKHDRDALSTQFVRKNTPLTLGQKLDVSHRIHHYEALLLRKMAKEAENLRKMYEHEAKRANELHANGEKLWAQIAELQAENDRLRNFGLRGGAHKIKRRLTGKQGTDNHG